MSQVPCEEWARMDAQKRAEAEARKVNAQEEIVQGLRDINGTLQEILMQLRQG